MHGTRGALIAAALAALCARAQAQSVSGRVVAADTGSPLANVRIEIDGAADEEPAHTDKDGRFAIPAPAERTTALHVSKAGYAPRTIKAADARDIRLARGAVIVGHIRDEFGTPLPFRHVYAQRRSTALGRSTFETTAGADTDDAGEYRIYGLEAGDYIVALGGSGVVVGPGGVRRPGGAERLPIRFYPEADRAETAQVFTLAAGAETTGLDFSTVAPTSPIGATRTPMRSSGAGIRGHVARTDGSPARRARIEVASTDRLFSPVTTVTDDDGMYQIGVPAGTYVVSATDVSFTTGRFGKGNRPDIVTVTVGAFTDGIDIIVPRPGAISGRIVDEYGDPIDDVRVALEVIRFDRGRRKVGPAFGVSPARTDDRGRFRLFGVPPGRYLVHASSGAATDAGTYFPGTVTAGDATSVELGRGQESVDVEFALTPRRAARIAGRVLTASGEPYSGAVYLLASLRSDAIAEAAPRKVVAEDGAFAFAGLAPGEYVIQAATSRLGVSAEGEFGIAFVNTSTDGASNVIIRMTAGSMVRGRLRFDGGDPPDRTAIELSSMAADPDFASLADNPVARADIHDDWTFEMSGLNGPRRIVLTRVPEGWMLGSMHAAGVDVTDEALRFGASAQSVSTLEIVLTNQITQLAGTVASDGSASPRAFAIVAFPEDPAAWYQTSRFIAFGRSGPDGAFTLSKLPPGRYFVAAFDDRDVPDAATAVDNLVLLRTLQARASRVSIAAGQRATVTVAPPPR